MQKLREEEARNRKRSKWSNWESSYDDSSYSDYSDDGDDGDVDGLNLAHEDILSKEEEDRLKMLERFEFISSRLEPDELVEGFVGFEDQLKVEGYSLRYGLAEEGSKAVVVEAARLQRQRIFGVISTSALATLALSAAASAFATLFSAFKALLAFPLFLFLDPRHHCSNCAFYSVASLQFM